MLAAIGVAGVDELFSDIPPALRADGLDLPPPQPEIELGTRLEGLAARNRVDLASFLGAGVYRHWAPAVVDQILLRGEWYTAYTPYQPEVSQGTLQSIYEYESLIGELMALDVVSASHYDGATATAEGAMMAVRQTRRSRLLVSRGVHPHFRGAVATYAGGSNVDVDEVPLVADGPAAGTTDLVALERMLGDGRAGRGRARGPAELPGAARADGRDRAPRARRRCEVRRGGRAGLAERPRAAGRVRRGRRGGRGPGARDRAAVRRPVPGHPRLHQRARPPDPGPPDRDDDRSRGQTRVRDDAAGPRAGHPAREGRVVDHHQSDPARARRLDLRRDDRPARAGGRRRARRRTSGGARGCPRRRGRPARPPGRVPQRVRRPGAGRAGRPSPTARSRGPRGPRPRRRAARRARPRGRAARVRDRGDDVRRDPALRRGAGRRAFRTGVPASAARSRCSPREPPDERHRLAPPANAVRALEVRVAAAASSRRRRPTHSRGSRPPSVDRRPPGCPSSASPRSCATTSTSRSSTTRSTRASTRSARAR